MATISHEQFIEKMQRKARDFDGAFGVQCVDLIKQHAFEVYGVKLPAFGGSARMGWYNRKRVFDPKLFDYIENKPNNFPEKGDYIIYEKPPVMTGHIAIVQMADVNDCLNFELNGATGNGEGKGYDAANFESKRDYAHCLGWIRFKKK